MADHLAYASPALAALHGRRREVPSPDPAAVAWHERCVTVANMVGAPTVELPEVLAGVRPDWHAHAACAGVGADAFFPEDEQPAPWVLDLCSGCIVARECAEAGARQSSGVWGGCTALDRRAKRQKAA